MIVSQDNDTFIEQLMLFFHKLTTDHIISVFGEEKGKELCIKYDEAFNDFYNKSLSLMPTSLSKRHGINSVFVLAFDKALEDENLSHEDLKKHIISIYSIMMDGIIKNQAKKLEESENPWKEFVEGSKKSNTELYENEYFNAIVSYDIDSVFGVDIQKCLYFEIFEKNKRQDLGSILCEYDHLLADAVEKWVRFERTKTIADGYSHCNFRYYPKEYSPKNTLYEDQEKISAIALDFVHRETGWGDPLQPQCEFEDFYLRGVKQLEGEKIVVLIEYHFDEDGFSMYPRIHILEGELILDKEGNIQSFKLEETFTGPGCVENPYKTEKEQ